MYFVRPTPQPVLGAAWASLLLPPPAGHRRTRILQAGLNLQITCATKSLIKFSGSRCFCFGSLPPHSKVILSETLPKVLENIQCFMRTRFPWWSRCVPQSWTISWFRTLTLKFMIMRACVVSTKLLTFNRSNWSAHTQTAILPISRLFTLIHMSHFCNESAEYTATKADLYKQCGFGIIVVSSSFHSFCLPFYQRRLLSSRVVFGQKWAWRILSLLGLDLFQAGLCKTARQTSQACAATRRRVGPPPSCN